MLLGVWEKEESGSGSERERVGVRKERKRKEKKERWTLPRAKRCFLCSKSAQTLSHFGGTETLLFRQTPFCAHTKKAKSAVEEKKE